MKKIVVIICLVCIFVFTGCSKVTEVTEVIEVINEFEEGVVVVSSLGESYTQFVVVDNNLSTDTAKIDSHTITATKELDITKIDDYAMDEYYYKYLYTAKIEGSVDKKYSGGVIYIYTNYPIQVQTEIIDDFNNGALIEEDGSFELNYYVYCNELLEKFNPYYIQIKMN